MPLPNKHGIPSGIHLCGALHLMNDYKTPSLDERGEPVDCYDECEVCIPCRLLPSSVY